MAGRSKQVRLLERAEARLAEETAQLRAELVGKWRGRADRLDEYAAGCRRNGVVSGPEGAEDAEAWAQGYRAAADKLELEVT